MNPFFSAELHSAGFLPHSHLFRDDIEPALELANFGGSHIYYICKAKKVNLIAEKTRLDGSRINLALSCPKHGIIEVKPELYLFHPFQDADPEFIKETFDLRIEPNDLQNIIFSDLRDSRNSVSVPLLNFLGPLDLDLGVNPEIIYIGQSSDILERWQNHKQVNKAVSMLNGDEEIRLYFIHFQFIGSTDLFDSIDKSEPHILHDNFLNNSNRKSEEFRDRVSLLEQALIHFYVPELNTQHVNGKTRTAHILRMAEKTGLKEVGLGLGMHGNNFQFWSPKQVCSEEVVTLGLSNHQPIFTPGLPEFEFAK